MEFSNPQVTHVSVDQWQSKTINGINKKVLDTVDMATTDLVNKFKQAMKTFPNHIFRANWQYNQFNHMKKNVNDEDCVMVYDFAENFRTQYQDEVQSAHWNYTQTTIHPVVCYYKCACSKVPTHSIVVISDDLTHDCF